MRVDVFIAKLVSVSTHVVFMVVLVSSIVVAAVDVLVGVALGARVRRHGGNDHSNAGKLLF